VARIWPILEGREHTPSAPWIEVPISEAIKLCELRQSDLVPDLAAMRGFAEPDFDLWYAGFKHVVVEVDDAEARQVKWKPGFYKSHLSPKEVFRRLIEEPLVAALGSDNVVRVEVAPTLDAEGLGAMLTTIVITPEAIQRLDGNRQGDAMAQLRKRLREMHVHGTPIPEYATEAELAEDVGSRP
jgi:hypothetical protein